METGENLIMEYSNYWVASFLGSGINGNLQDNSQEEEEEEVASFLGSGINGNRLAPRRSQDLEALEVASFLGSGINGNNRIQ